MMEMLIFMSLLRGVQAFVPLEPQRNSESRLQAERVRRQWDEWPPRRAYEDEEETDYEDIPPWLRKQASSAPVMWHPDYSPETHSYPEYSYKEELEGVEEEYYPEPPQPYLAHPPLLQENHYYEQDDTIYTYEQPKTKKDSDRALAAGLGTAALGFLVGGPMGAAVLGFSSAYAAENAKEHTLVGDSARAIGDVALAAASKGLELNEKHDVVDKAIHAAEEAWMKAQELDREYQIVQKAKDVAIYGGTATLRFVQEHNLVERSVRGIGQGIGWVTQRVAAGSLDGVKRDRKSLKDAAPKKEEPNKLRPEQQQRQPSLPRQQQYKSEPQRRPRTAPRTLMPSESYDSFSVDGNYNDSPKDRQPRRRAEDYHEPNQEGEARRRPPPRKPKRQPEYY